MQILRVAAEHAAQEVKGMDGEGSSSGCVNERDREKPKDVDETPGKG